MNKTKHLKGHCQACGGHIEFPAEAAGMSVDCPHCGKVTELLLAPPPEEPLIPRRTIIWTALTVMVLLVGLAAALVALNRVERKAAAKHRALEPAHGASPSSAANTSPTEQTDAVTKAGFAASEITLQRLSGSGLVYAVGSLTNATARQRFGIKVVVDLFDANGQKAGEATDYQPTIEPNGQWNFKALAVEKKAVSAKIARVQEQR